MEKVLDLVLVALAISAVSLTVTRSHLTEPWREHLLDHRPNDLFTRMITCPYCFAHWLAVFGAVWWGVRYLDWHTLGLGRAAVSVLIVGFALVSLSTIVMGLMIRLMLATEWEMEKLKRRVRELERLDRESD
jgi:hypothetical protein